MRDTLLHGVADNLRALLAILLRPFGEELLVALGRLLLGGISGPSSRLGGGTGDGKGVERSMSDTYGRPSPQLGAINRVLVEPLPLLKRLLGDLVVFVIVPFQHLRLVLNARGLAEGLDNARGIVKEVISIDDADLCGGVCAIGIVGPVRAVRVAIGKLSSEFRTNLSVVAEVVEQTAELIIASFVRAEVVEPRHLIERWDGAAVVARDAVPRVANEKGEVEVGQEVPRDHSRVARLSLVRVRVRWPIPVGPRGDRGQSSSVGSDATLVVDERGSDLGWLVVGRDPVLGHVLDEDALALGRGEFAPCPPIGIDSWGSGVKGRKQRNVIRCW